MVKNRNIVLALVFSILTCGIYGIYWIAALQNDSIRAAKEEGTSGGMVVLLTLVTCGIYSYYWAYKLGQRTDKLNGNPNGNSSILFLILSFLGFGFVNMCIAQAAVNNHANA